MMEKIDRKHSRLPIENGFVQFGCRNDGNAIQMKVHGEMKHCPLCGEKL